MMHVLQAWALLSTTLCGSVDPTRTIDETVTGSVPVVHPEVASMTPRGGRRGTDLELTIRGQRLRTLAGLVLFRPGIEVLECHADNDKLAKVRIRIAKDCPLGVHQVLVRTELGLSALQLFMVGTLPEANEREPNNDRDRAQAIPLNVTINGRVTAEDVDVFSVSVKKGQRLNVEIEGLRLGDLEFDPHLTIHDDRGKRLAMVDDTVFGMMDPLASVCTDRDAMLFLSVRESARGGSNTSFYRLHVGTFPRATIAFPSGGPAGSELRTRLIGPDGEFETTISIPRTPGLHKHFVTTENGTSPTPIQVVATQSPNTFETGEGGPKTSSAAISPWQMIGPFANPRDKSGRSLGHGTIYPPEKRAKAGEPPDFKSAQPGRDGEIAWKKQSRLRDNAVHDLRRILRKSDNSVVYLARTITAPTARKVLCLISGDDTLRVYHDHKRVLDDPEPSSATPNQHRLILDLVKGRNQLLVKVANRSGRLAFFCRVLDPMRFKSYGVVSVPSTIHGRIAEPGEQDRFAFLARKGEQIVFRTISRALRSPLDPAVGCYCTHERFYAGNDDAAGLDSLLRFRAPFTGEFVFTIRDMLMDASPSHVYQLEVARPNSRPLTTRASVPGIRSEWTVAVPKGGRNAILLNASNLDRRAGIQLALGNLPPGVSADVPVFGAGMTSVPVVFRAEQSAPCSSRLIQIDAKATKKSVDSKAVALTSARFRQPVVVVEARNRRPFLSSVVERMPLAVARPTPFAVHAEPIRVPLVRNSPLRLRFKITRAKGYKGSIRVRMLYNPAGVSSNQTTVRAGENEGYLTLNANGGARIGVTPIVLIASGAVDGAAVSSSTELLNLTVSAPWIQATVGTARCDQGSDTTLALSFKRNRDFDGPVEAQWIGLPRGVTCGPIAIEPDTKKLSLPVSIDAKTRAGRYRSFRLRLKIRSGADWIVQDFRQGEIRIDKVRRKK